MLDDARRIEVPDGLVLPSPDDQTLATRGDVNRAVAELKPTIRNYLIIGVASGNILAAFVVKYVGQGPSVQTALDLLSHVRVI